MFITIGINCFCTRYEKRGKELKATSELDSTVRARRHLTSFSVLLAFISVKAGYPVLDPVISILYPSFIAHLDTK